jgi:hypothetical protein
VSALGQVLGQNAARCENAPNYQCIFLLMAERESAICQKLCLYDNGLRIKGPIPTDLPTVPPRNDGRGVTAASDLDNFLD